MGTAGTSLLKREMGMLRQSLAVGDAQKTTNAVITNTALIGEQFGSRNAQDWF
jgi:hypothetical protein